MSAETAQVAAPPVAASDVPEPIAAAEAATDVSAAVAIAEAVVVENEASALSPSAASEPDVALVRQQREQAAERIRSSALLPPVIRDCLARVALASSDTTPGGETRVPVDELVRAVEEAVPDFLRIDRRRAASPEHPVGEAFFSGDPSGLSDQQAEEIARGQLARSGLLRGQRVRVAD